jgi:hypothetical protein
MIWFEKLSKIPSADVSSARTILQAYHVVNPLNEAERVALKTFIRWRLIRDVVAYWKYRPTWWLDVVHVATAFFSGTAEDMIAGLAHD